MTSGHRGPQPRQYEISVLGRLGETMRTAFPGLRTQPRGGDTMLTGAQPDQAALYGVLAEIEAPGLSCSKSAACAIGGTLNKGQESPRRTTTCCGGSSAT